MTDAAWAFFNYPVILQEAKARLAEARRHGQNVGAKDTLEFWCAWAAHANAASVFVEPMSADLRRKVVDFVKVRPK